MLKKMIEILVRRLKETYGKVMDLPDSPRKIALGAALGTSLDFLPMPFVSIPVSFLLAKLMRINAAAAVLAVVFFKWAVPFFFAFNYYVGRALLGGSPPQGLEKEVSLLDLSAWAKWLTQLGHPFLLGASINSLVAGSVTYFVVKALLDCRRKRREISAKPHHPGKIR